MISGFQNVKGKLLLNLQGMIISSHMTSKETGPIFNLEESLLQTEDISP